MKKLYYISLFAIVSILIGCKKSEQDTLEAPKKVLLSALQKLDVHDYEGYLNDVDLSDISDSSQVEFLQMALNQHQDWQEKKKGTVTNLSIVDAKVISDSVCTIYYQFTFSDNTQETCSQKMVKVDNAWKIRLRN